MPNTPSRREGFFRADYYIRFLNPKAFGQIFGETGLNRVFVNAEEDSVPLTSEFQMQSYFCKKRPLSGTSNSQFPNKNKP